MAMDLAIFILVTIFAFSQTTVADKTAETFEKFYVADTTYTPTPGGTHQHGALGISTVARFSMLSNTPTLFKVMRPGLQNEANTASFESLQKPGYFLRYKNYKFHMEKEDGTTLFAKDATFRERQGPRGRAYELLGRNNWFICHSDETPFTLKAQSQKIGSKEFVGNCVFVPVRRTSVTKKNIVKTVPSGGAMVVNAVPKTQNTDKCISIRFVNKLGGPVRVVSSMKPEGYLVTANAFKLKTIFKHANHKQRHVIFYAENVQDRDDDVMLNDRNVFTTKPNICAEEFQDVVLASQANEQKGEDSATAAPEATEPALNLKTKPAETPQPSGISEDVPKPPAISVNAPRPPATISKDVSTRPAISDTNLTPQADNSEKPVTMGTTVPLSSQVTPKPLTTPSGVVANEVEAVSSTDVSTPSPVSSSFLSRSNSIPPVNLSPKRPGYTAPLKQQIQSLDDILQKRIHANRQSPVAGATLPNPVGVTANGYEAWSSYGPCSVSCGVGYRRRNRVCRPGTYCSGPAAETRACIKEQCVSDCVHTSEGTVRPGSCCHFPFTFNGGQYYHCILSPQNNERLWCATTPYFEQDKQWGYCPRSTKAPVRSFTQPLRPVQLPQTQQLSAVANPRTTQYVSHYNNYNYNDPYRAYVDNSVPCSVMCTRVCDPTCPRHCCLATRTNVPITAYLGANYGPTDKRSFINPYRARYGRSLKERTRKR